MVCPVVQQARNVPYQLRHDLEKELRNLQREDIIEKATNPSEWVLPIVITSKKSGDMRLCIDMQQADRAVIWERYPIPRIEDILSDLQGSQYYSKLDLNSAFNQIEVDEQSSEITTFITHIGLFRFKRLLFGINCSPEIFQRIIDQVVRGEGVKAFIDDILIYLLLLQVPYL